MGAMDEYNRPASTSPNLDRLAARGIRFVRGYANSAVCSPTRFALMTGRWQYRLRGGAEEPLPTAMRDDKILGLPPEHPTMPSLLREAGYRTALIGKWHLGPAPNYGPTKSGYEYFFGFQAGGSDYFAHCDPRGRPDLWENDQAIERQGYLTDILSERACDFISSTDDAQPSLLSLHYSAPHWPWLTRDDEAESRRIAGVGKHLDGGSIRTYQRMIHHMDEGIGWVISALEKKGVLDDTLIVFTSDNGGERFSNNWPFVGQKMDLLEGGIRVPVIAHWPDGLPGGRVSGLSHMTMDWAATLLDAAGVEAAPGYPLDGMSLLPCLRGQSAPFERDLCWRMKHRDQRALIRGDWKYLQMDGTSYLFDLSRDARERANLREKEPGKLQELSAAWRRWNESLPPIPDDARAHLVFDERQLPRATF